MRILVIGGTRFIGAHVVKELVESNNEVTVFHRGETESSTVPKDAIHIHGSRDKIDDFASDFKRFSPEAILDSGLYNERDAKRTLELAKRLTNRIVVLSSMDVYRAYGLMIGTESGSPEPTPIHEESGALRSTLYPYREKLNGEWAREYDKIPIERLVLNDDQVEGTVLRLPMVYGLNDSQHRLYQWLKPMKIDSRPAIVLGERYARQRVSRGYVENVAHAISLALTGRKGANRIYNVADSPAFSTLEWGMNVARIVEWKGRVVTVPDEEAPSAACAPIEQDLVSDTSKIRSELGFKEVVSLDDGLSRTIHWELQSPSSGTSNQHFDYEEEDSILRKLGAKAQ